MNQQFQPHVTEKKKSEVKEIIKLFNEYPIVGIVNLENLPTVQLQKMNKKIRDSMKLKITKKTLMLKAIEQIKDKKNIEKIHDYLQGTPALLFSKENPFRLYKILEKAQTNAPARPGQKAPNDIVIPAGPTNFTPGPMIGELGQLGIKTEVKEGKINVKEDKIIVKEGEEIKPKVADLLAKFGIQPMKIGLNMVAAYENGEILTKEVLHIDDAKVIQDLQKAYMDSLKLAMSISYISKETVELMFKKGYINSKSVMKSANLTEDAVKFTGESSSKSEPHVETKHEAPKSEHKPEVKLESSKTESYIENKNTVNQADMDAAQKVVRDMQERAVKIDTPAEKKQVSQEKDITKIINELKDKKSRGEI